MLRYHLIATDSIRPPLVSSIGFSADPQVTRYGPSVRNQYIIHYVLSGKGFFNGALVKKGEGFLITPGMAEEYHPSEEEPWSFLWVISDDPAMQPFFTAHHANRATGVFSFHDRYEVDMLAGQLQAAASSFSSAARLSELFLHLFHTYITPSAAVRSPATKSYYEFSVNYIKANLHLPLSVRDLCAVTGITQPYLYRIFKQAEGRSPREAIQERKLNEAKRLLAKTSFSVSQIAAAVGFSNVLDFSKFFSAKAGCAPTAWRASYR